MSLSCLSMYLNCLFMDYFGLWIDSETCHINKGDYNLSPGWLILAKQNLQQSPLTSSCFFMKYEFWRRRIDRYGKCLVFNIFRQWHHFDGVFQHIMFFLWMFSLFHEVLPFQVEPPFLEDSSCSLGPEPHLKYFPIFLLARVISICPTNQNVNKPIDLGFT